MLFWQFPEAQAFLTCPRKGSGILTRPEGCRKCICRENKPDKGTLASLSFGPSLHRQDGYQGGSFLKQFLASLSIQHSTALHRYLKSVNPFSPTPFPKQRAHCARVPSRSQARRAPRYRYRVKMDFPAAPTPGLTLPPRPTE